MPGPFLSTSQAAAYVGHTREWLREHRAEIGYSRPSGGHPRFRVEDLDKFMAKFRVNPPAESGTARRSPVARAVGSTGGRTNVLTGLPRGTDLSAVGGMR